VIVTNTFGKKCRNHAIKDTGYHFIDLRTSFHGGDLSCCV
jgi:hypothetical protein